MKVLDLCRARYSVRDFTGESVKQEDLEYVMEAGRWAATSRNRQARRFVVVNKPDKIKKVVREASMQDFVADAGVLVFGFTTDDGKAGSVADVIISMTQMEIAAVEKGLGTIWLGIWEEEGVRQQLEIPSDNKIVVCLALGHPEGGGEPKDKLPLENLYHFNSFADCEKGC